MVRSEVPLISVCIPVFNGQNYIAESIKSVLQQTENNFELLIVDNCSTDDTFGIVAGYNDPRIKVFKNTVNIGSINNFNLCIELSRGEYFVLLPHDDLLLPTALKTFSGALIADPQIGLAYSSYYMINENGERTNLRMVNPDNKIMSSEEAIQEFIIHGNPVQCAMTRKEIFSHLGSFDPNVLICADIDMWSRIVIDGYKAAYFRIPQNCLRARPDSGQNAFIKPDEQSLRTIADHMGYVPSQAFIRNNTYHSLVFKHLQTLFSRIPTSSDLQKLRPLSAKWMFGPLIRHLIFSLKLGNWKDVKEDMDSLAKIVRWAGVFTMIPVLLSMPLKLIKRYKKRLLT